MKLYQYQYSSPMGALKILSNGSHIVGLLTPCQAVNTPVLPALCNDPAISAACNWLDAYFSGKTPSIKALPLLAVGTPFQKWVWQYLQTIPWGQAVTYGQVAKEYAREYSIQKMSAQAVGQAVGANPIPIIIPCHRVLGSGSKLTGYTGGIEYKKWLLEHEGIAFYS